MRRFVLVGLMALAVATALLGSGCTLIVKKTVINDDGGSKGAADFSFSLNGGAAVAFEPDGENVLTVGAGAFSVTEVADSAYAATLEGCSGVIAAGETKTCTITNDDLPPPPPPGVGYCVKTSSHGWTFIQATAGAFEPGQPWHQLYVEKATVLLDGKAVTFAGIEPWEPNGGIILAPSIEGIGLTCDQPYVG